MFFSFQIAWIRYDTRAVMSMQDQKVTQSSHYALLRKEDRIDLVITNITEDDAGTYICQLNSDPIINHVGLVIIYIEPLDCSLFLFLSVVFLP